MNRVLAVVVVLSIESVAGYANPEITVDLPGGVAMEMVWIEPGSFLMGALDSDDRAAEWEKLQHPVTISKGFYLGKYELTQAQWEAVMGTRPWSGQEHVQMNPDNPAVYISWDDIKAFIQKLNTAAGAAVYRLPTEAEWEYACRAGTTTQWSFGDEESKLGDYEWYGANAWDVGERYAHAVGTKKPNPWGLYDMHGNVAEWVQDWWSDSFLSSSQTDPTGPSAGFDRVSRSDNFISSAAYKRSVRRVGNPPDTRSSTLGARLLNIGPALNAPSPVLPQSWGEVKRPSK